MNHYDERLVGRFARKAIKHPETSEVIVAENELITEDIANEIVECLDIEDSMDSFCVYM